MHPLGETKLAKAAMIIDFFQDCFVGRLKSLIKILHVSHRTLSGVEGVMIRPSNPRALLYARHRTLA
jgi:hypothetical protein